jgi:hypothetical protein
MGTPVSGPGQFSQRTDKAVGNANSNLPNAAYGENKDYQEQKAGAPMAASPGVPQDLGALMGSMRPDSVGLDAESQQPDTPVTDGAAMGAGAGPEILGPQPEDPSTSRNASWMMAAMYMADQPNSSDAARNLVRKLKADTGM